MNYQQRQVPITTINPIEELASEIQKLPAEIRWLHVQPDAMLEKALGRRISLGPRRKFAQALLSGADKVGIGYWLMLVTSALLLLGLFLGQFRERARTPTARLFFVGNDGARDPSLQRSLESRFGEEATYLNEDKTACFHALLRVSIKNLFGAWLRTLSAVHTTLSNRERLFYPHVRYLTEFALCGHRYAYFLAWFELLGATVGPSLRVAFGAASPLVAHPAVQSKVWCSYYPHGLMARTVVFPSFSEIWCSNTFEVAHMLSRLPGADVRTHFSRVEKFDTERMAAIACGHLDDPDAPECRSFLDWASRRNLKILVRKHPRMQSALAERWRSHRGVVVESAERSFDEFLEQHRPRVLVTWYSTTVLDALCKGILPVTMCGSEPNGVVPIEKISINWPMEEERLALMLDDASACQAIAAEFQIALR